MKPGVPIDQTLAVIIALVALMQVGIKVSAIGYFLFPSVQRLRALLGKEPLPESIFKDCADAAVRILYSPISARISPLDRPAEQKRVLLYLGYGLVVLAFSVILEIATLYTVAGLAIAQYHLSGTMPTLEPAMNTVVACVILFAISMMTYGSRLVQRDTNYA